MELIHGAKGGGGGGHTPTESPDSLLSESTAKILLAISEGEIAGGLDDTRIFLDDTPIGNADGTKNFEGVTWEFRLGSEHQEYIQGIPSVDSETSVGLELKDDQPYVRSINNTQLSAVRIRLSVPQLFQQHDNGDTTGYRIEYAIDLSTDGAGYNEVLKSAFDGKTTSEYQRTHRIDLPKANTGWQIRVRRLTKNQNTARIADKVTISAVTDVIDAKLRYPNTALLFITFNARQFNNRIPKISVRPKGGLLIKVPTNYDPINRTYSGVWDGTFKLAATNNPAWVFYDLVLNNRYGCGDRIKASQIEKWDLYKIAQYCDELVPDGHGGDGKEPRFLCDVYVQSQESAYQVLRDIAAIFRGMTFWADNKVNVVADMPDSIFRTFTNANIVGGKPTYSGGSQQNRYTQALVSYTDTNNHSNDAIEAVADIKLQRRYGVRKTEISAIGCTRQTEANRRGRWSLLTNANDRVISFATGLEGAIPSPGHIIAVADSTLAGRDNGGRISRVEGRKITLDRRANIKAGDRLIVNLPNGRSEGRTVSLVADNIITVSTEYSQEPEKNAVWTVDADDLALQLYRVVNITDNGDNTYTITGAIHNPSNYDHIDSGARIDERPITIVPPGVQAPPKNIRISSYSQVNQGISFTTLRVDWDTVDNAITYEAQWRRDNNNWVSMPRSSTCGFEVDGIYAGRYQVRVRAINASEISSVWANAQETTLTGKVGNPPKPVNFRASSLVFGIKLDWGFGENTGDTLKTEIQYSKKNDGEGLMLLSDVPYPSKTYEMAGLAAGVIFYFRARLVDKTGNQSEWTDFIRGESEFDTSTILPELGNHFMTTEAGKQLDEKLNWNTESIAELVNATYELSTDLLVRDGNAQAGIKELRKVFANQQEAWAQEIKEIYSAVGENKSAIEETQTSITKLDEAFGQRFTAIRTDMDNAQADIISNSQAISNTNKAFAENKTQVQAKFDEQEGMIQEKMQATFEQSGDGVVTHSINITIKHNGVSYNAAGQVISAQVKNGKLESFFGYNANNFAWYNPVNGKMELFMYAKNGQLFIRDLFIEDGSITNAKIGNVIQSNNYLNGRPSWIINKNGFAEFQNIKARGEIEATSGRLKNVVIEESCDILGKLKVENLEGNIVTVTQDVYHNLSFSHNNIVELFKVKRRTQKCFIWV
ncbi:TPA: TipJ family phage tail tip protein, partial [Proteus mirabilis]